MLIESYPKKGDKILVQIPYKDRIREYVGVFTGKVRARGAYVMGFITDENGNEIAVPWTRNKNKVKYYLLGNGYAEK